jgi:hypothetical protein
VTTLTSLAKVEAIALDRAQLIRTVRHVHVSPRPLIFVPLQLAGEACAPLAAMVGDDRDDERLLIAYEPRDRTERFRFAAGLGEVMLGYVDGYAAGDPGEGVPYPDAPQVWVPNAGGVKFAELLGRSTRFRRTEGPYPVPASVPLLGRWVTYLAERAQHPLSSLFLSATQALTAHWATGQSATEDQNLATLLAWIAPSPGQTGAQAALLAENPARCPPAGPVTDPDFDRDVLEGLIKAIVAARQSGDAAARERAQALMARELHSVLKPTWDLMWQAVDLLRSLPPGDHVAERWKTDRFSFTGYVRYLQEGGFPQARRDAAVDAARRLARLENEAQQLAAHMAYDDPLVMAEYRMTGDAFAGPVVRAEPDRLDETGKRARLRPWITVETTDDVLAEHGADLRSPARPAQQARVIEVDRAADRTRVTIELQSGMGRKLVPEPGSVPGLGDVVCYTTFKAEFQPPPKFPDRADTPWTHGGPPPEYVPRDEEAAEEWE